MGWWDSDKTPGVILGDDPLDETFRYLEGLVGLYEEHLHRRPTVEEVRCLLEVSLRTNGRLVLHDFDDRAVTAVKIDTAKKPKDQPYEAGDFFTIPLGDGKYAIARIMDVYREGPPGKTRMTTILIEIFREVAKKQRHSPNIIASGRLLPPIQISTGLAFKNWRWTVVASDADYRAPKEDLAQEFLRSDGYIFHAVDWKGKVLRKVGQDVANKLQMADASADEVEDRIKEALAKPKAAAAVKAAAPPKAAAKKTPAKPAAKKTSKGKK